MSSKSLDPSLIRFSLNRLESLCGRLLVYIVGKHTVSYVNISKVSALPTTQRRPPGILQSLLIMEIGEGLSQAKLLRYHRSVDQNRRETSKVFKQSPKISKVPYILLTRFCASASNGGTYANLTGVVASCFQRFLRRIKRFHNRALRLRI